MKPLVPDPTPACATCPAHRTANGSRLGLDRDGEEFIVALAGNPNTGKSTVFNALTGLRQHTGNWPGKTVTRAEGAFEYQNQHFKLVDLPGTYSLLATSQDEQIARDFILFGQPDVTVVVVDATRLERNLNLVLQVLEITDRVVVCLNLMDEARRHGLQVDDRRLARDLGVPVVPTAARYEEGLNELRAAISDVATGRSVGRRHRLANEPAELKRAVTQLIAPLEKLFPGLPNAHWVALRLLDGDERVVEAVRRGELGGPAQANSSPPDQSSDRRAPEHLLAAAEALRWETGDLHEPMVEAIYADATRIAGRAVTRPGRRPRFDLDRTLDRLVTSRILGFPLMIALFTVVFWITISGANIPSGWLSSLLLGTLHPALREGAVRLGLPWWLSGVLVEGMYLTAAWVVSVMLPPMAVFFPLFTLLEDLGYLPRVAFNLDHLFKKAGAHGKQALSMMMGFGCNAVGVIATRVIDSPRERLIAILTNNFALCNGRWPTQILLATLFIGALVPTALAGLISAAAVVGVAVLGVLLTFAASWALSRTALRGEVSTFSLELPPYRPPRVLQTLYTSLIDRTLFVLWRAVVFALPAGAVIWLLTNVHVGGLSLAEHLVSWLHPLGVLIGLNGIILLAYMIAIPANEIVIPTVLMLTVLVAKMSGAGQGAGVLFALGDADTLALLQAGGWTVLTAVNLMLFSLVHNPCSTTLYTIYKETGSLKWTAVAAALPLALGFALTFFVAQVWRLLGGVG
ncbi:MAG: ferrous iron transport protein B [Chloroflexota bacterium]